MEKDQFATAQGNLWVKNTDLSAMFGANKKIKKSLFDLKITLTENATSADWQKRIENGQKNIWDSLFNMEIDIKVTAYFPPLLGTHFKFHYAPALKWHKLSCSG